METKEILVLTKYPKRGASSRLRFYQFFPWLELKGLEFKTSSFFDDKYLSKLYEKTNYSLIEIALRLFLRIKEIIQGRSIKTWWVQSELFPYLPSWVEQSLKFFNIFLIVDYDDAIFHRYDQHRFFLVRFLLGKKIDRVMRSAQVVIAGNNYLAQRAINAGAKTVVIIPTVVDINKYQKRNLIDRQHSEFVIGWIGTPVTQKFVYPLIGILTKLRIKYPFKLKLVGASNCAELNHDFIEILQWTEDTEKNQIDTFTIGIMPLTDSYFERGKCGYKLIQYMACHLPVIASAVGVNTEIVEDGKNGFLVNNLNEWEIYLGKFLNNQVDLEQFGDYSRRLYEDKYSFQAVQDKLLNVFKNSQMGTK